MWTGTLRYGGANQRKLWKQIAWQKIIIEFDGFEEAKEARTAMDAQKWKYVVWELDQELRKVTKYGASLVNPNEEALDEETTMAE